MKYIVGILTGGLMECPEFELTGPYKLIEADSESAALKLYDSQRSECYFQSRVAAFVSGDKVTPGYYCSQYKADLLYSEIKQQQRLIDIQNATVNAVFDGPQGRQWSINVREY